MKKIFVLLALVFLVAGCTVLKSDNLEKVIDEVLTSNENLANQYFAGYQYYLPREVSLINKYDYNTTLQYKGNKIYLYVDIISYYHKKEENYETKDDIYFSKVLEHNGKKGYISIEREDDVYYVDMRYNYGHIETYVKEEDLAGTIIQSCYILNTLKFNDAIIDSLIGENKIEYQEEQFNLFKSEGSSSNYLNTIDDSDGYNSDDDEINLDDDSIELEEDNDLNNW